MGIEDVDHLAHARDRAVDDVVAEHHGEGLVADQVLGHQDGMAKAERLTLAHVARR